MSIDYFLSRVLRIFTLLSLGITLLFIYRGLPDPVAVHFGETGRGDGFLPKAEVFYLLAGVITVLNILILLLIKTVEKIPAPRLDSLNRLFPDKAPENIKKISTAIFAHKLSALDIKDGVIYGVSSSDVLLDNKIYEIKSLQENI